MRHFLGLFGIILGLAAARGADVGDLIKQLKGGDNDSRRAAAKALGEGGPDSKAAVPALIWALKDKDLFVRRFSAQALGEIGPAAKAAVAALKATLDDPKKEVQEAAANALGKLGPSGVATLIGILRDDNKDPMTCRQVLDSLSSLGAGAHSAVPVLTELLKATGGKNKKKMAPENLRVDAAIALGVLANPRDKDAIATLQTLGDNKSKTPPNLKMAANIALRKIKSKK